MFSTEPASNIVDNTEILGSPSEIASFPFHAGLDNVAGQDQIINASTQTDNIIIIPRCGGYRIVRHPSLPRSQ